MIQAPDPERYPGSEQTASGAAAVSPGVVRDEGKDEMSKRVSRKQAARVVREQLARERRLRRARVTAVVAVAVLVIAGLAGYAIYHSQRPSEAFPVPKAATPDGNGIKVGDGPVTVEIYLDYLCPACQRFEQAAQPTLDRYLESGRINVVYRPVSILDRASTNRYSSRSAAGAGCAADQDKIVEYTKALYARQPAEGGAGHTNDEIADLAAQAGLSRDSFKQCLDDDRYGDWVKDNTDAMAERGVNSTPTVFVNGRNLGSPTLEELTAAIDGA